jgi:competence protein ComEC
VVKWKFKTFSVVQFAAIFCSVLIYTGIIKKNNNSQFYSLFSSNEISTIKGNVKTSPAITSNRNYYFFKLELSEIISKISNIKTSGTINILCPKEIVEAHFPGKLYDFNGVVLEQGLNVILTGYVSNELFICSQAECIDYKNWFCKIRAVFRMQFKRLMFQWGKAGGLLLALLSGAREYTDEKLSEAFRLSGLSHVLALSGMHLSFFSGFTLNVTKIFFGKKKSFIFSIFFVLFFVWFAGFSPSLFRAFLCFLIIAFCQYLNVEISMLSVLSLSFLIQIIFRSDDVYSVSFILSYMALTGIILLSDFFKKYFSYILIKKFSEAFSVSVSAQLFTSMITVKFFKVLTPVGILSSVFTSDLFNIFLITGFVLVILSFLFPPLINVSGLLLNYIYIIIEKGVIFFAQFKPIVFN